ncbi:uncharacterized protein LOC110264149 [Arachis ipaensis]|uniref:uncharacterized protein LOC110264149 n=1 Tax=Arachis ipaensis TaxID=130454 RepID=UPI000A2B7FFA|nr:uncharacterized protein LOC110264149 [Arachis ipaensis]
MFFIVNEVTNIISYILHGVQGMPMTFFPTEDMQVVGLDLAAAAYIFNNVLDQDELLVPNPHCAVTRGALRTLEPGKLIVDDVLILLASMLTQSSSRVQWFLPTTLTVSFVLCLSLYLCRIMFNRKFIRCVF